MHFWEEFASKTCLPWAALHAGQMWHLSPLWDFTPYLYKDTCHTFAGTHCSSPSPQPSPLFMIIQENSLLLPMPLASSPQNPGESILPPHLLTSSILRGASSGEICSSHLSPVRSLTYYCVLYAAPVLYIQRRWHV